MTLSLTNLISLQQPLKSNNYKGLYSKNMQSGPLPDRRAQENATVPALMPSNFNQQEL